MSDGGDRFVNTSGKDDWMSPDWAVVMAAKLAGVEHFDLDAAALDFSKISDNYYGPDHVDEKRRDALSIDWPPVSIYCNPPYSKKAGGLARWCERFVDASRRGATVAALFFARTETAAWHDYVTKAAEVYLFRGRLRFLDPDSGEPSPNVAPAPSCLVIWRPGDEGPPTYHYIDARRKR